MFMYISNIFNQNTAICSSDKLFLETEEFEKDELYVNDCFIKIPGEQLS